MYRYHLQPAVFTFRCDNAYQSRSTFLVLHARTVAVASMACTFYLIAASCFASQAHQRNLSAGLRNDWSQLLDLEPEFDWALSEDCLFAGMCNVSGYGRRGERGGGGKHSSVTKTKHAHKAHRKKKKALTKNRRQQQQQQQKTRKHNTHERRKN